MNPKNKIKAQVSYKPCPPEEFAGRFNEKRKLLEILEEARHQGQMVMVSGARGSGKSSFLEWAEYEIQNRKGGLENPAIKKEFMETPGMIFTTYKRMLTDLQGHQKLGWFKKTINNKKVKEAIGVTLGVLEKAALFTGPGKIVADAGISAAKTFMPKEQFEYPQLLTSFLSVLRCLSDELTKNNRFLALICDDSQWSSGPDYHLLKDLIRNLPAGIALISAFRLEDKSMEKYVELRQELDRFGYIEIRLSGMSKEEIKDFSKLRYNLSVNDATAEFLRINIGDPFCLVGCFNFLQTNNLKADLVNVQKILPQVVKPERCVYATLDEEWQKRVTQLCILRSPISLSLISCMLGMKEQEMASLQDELDGSVAFRKLEKEAYDFTHPSLREYCREKLPEDTRIRLHSQAAKCFEVLKERILDKWYVDLSLAEHLFFGQEYEEALDLNLEFGHLLYDLFDYSLALQLTERAITCGEETNNKNALSATLHQKGIILQHMFEFEDSLDAYNQSLKIDREMGDREGEAKTLHQMGMVYEETNRFKEALDYYNQSLKITREIGDRAVKAKTLHQMGMVYEETNRFKEALDYYNESLEIEREIGDRAVEAQTLHQMGMVYELTNRFKEALDYYNQSLEIEREVGNKSGEEISLKAIKELEEKMKKKK